MEKLEKKAEEEKESERQEEKKVVKEDGTTTPNKAERLLEEKMAVSKDGTIYLNDTDMKTIIEAAREEDEGKTTVKNRPQAVFTEERESGGRFQSGCTWNQKLIRCLSGSILYRNTDQRRQ